jgi:retinol-binding protein 3
MEIRPALVLFFATLGCTRSQPAPVGALPTSPDGAEASPGDLSDDDRRRLVDQIARELEAHYVFPGVGARMASAVRERASSGGYDDVHSAADLARVITDQMRDISHDRHALLERTPPPEQATAEEAEWTRTMAQNHATSGFGATERLPGNVAHLIMTSFEPGPDVPVVVTRRLSEIADADALIVDLRDNSGGDPATVAFVASYLFDPPRVHLNDMFWRDDGSTDPFFTTPDVPGKRYGAQKPVFVLTSKHTFSAAEEFAYDLQSLHRGQVIGEPTAGGAHPVAVRKLSPLLSLRVPTGRAINPVTKTDWEGTGVKPDVAVDAASSLHAAQVLALRSILGTTSLSAAKRREAKAALDSLGGGE